MKKTEQFKTKAMEIMEGIEGDWCIDSNSYAPAVFVDIRDLKDDEEWVLFNSVNSRLKELCAELDLRIEFAKEGEFSVYDDSQTDLKDDEEMARLDKFDDRVKESERKFALKAGDEYFGQLIDSIDRLKREVVRHKEGFESAREGESFKAADRKKTPLDMVNQIVWCVNEVQQFTGNHAEAARATMKIATAFDVNCW